MVPDTLYRFSTIKLIVQLMYRQRGRAFKDRGMTLNGTQGVPRRIFRSFGEIDNPGRIILPGLADMMCPQPQPSYVSAMQFCLDILPGPDENCIYVKCALLTSLHVATCRNGRVSLLASQE